MTPLDAALETLLKAALLGTGREVARESAATLLDGPLQPFATSQENAEATLLSAAATLTLCARAGALPMPGDAPAIALCPPETQPYFSPRAALLLGWVLNEHRDLLPQVLQRAAQSGQIAPPSLLLSLLDAGRQSRELRPFIAPLLGERGRWLAQLNPDWKHVAAPLADELEKAWQEGEAVARREALRLQRERETASAREWLEAVFKSEPARERAEFLGILENGLSNEDEPFLESALDDKSKEVRAVAVSLLEKLPDSRLVARAKTELESLLKWKPGALEVILPAQWNAQWARDGLEEKAAQHPRDKKLGLKAAWLHRFLSRVPPAHWESQWSATPAQIVAAAPQEWRDLLWGAWWNAALLVDDVRWLQPILQSAGFTTVQHQWTFQGLSPATADALFLWIWQQEENAGAAFIPLAQLMQWHPGPWGRELSARFLAALQKYLAHEIAQPRPQQPAQFPQLQHPQQFYWLMQALASFADKLSVEMAAEAAHGWPQEHEDWERWRPAIEKFRTRLQLRADLQNEFSRVTS